LFLIYFIAIQKNPAFLIKLTWVIIPTKLGVASS